MLAPAPPASLSGSMSASLRYFAAGVLSVVLLQACSSSSDTSGSSSDGGAGQGGEASAPVAQAGAGGAIDDEDVSFPQALLDAIDAYQNGGEVDLDGDGTIDLKVEIERHQRISQVLEGGEVVLTVTRLDDGSTTKVGDFNLDGEPDYFENESDSSAGFSRRTEQDLDFDGQSDERERFEINPALGTTQILQEAFDGAVWQVVADGTDETGFVAAGVNAGCSDDVPTSTKFNQELTVFGEVRIVQCSTDKDGNCLPGSRQGPNAGGCSPKQTKQIKQALAQLFDTKLEQLMSLGENSITESSVAKCLNKRRPGLIDALLDNMVRGGGGLGDETGSSGIFSGTRFSCGINCDGSGPVSLGNTSRLHRERINLNMSQTSIELVDTLLHELLHSAGFDGPPDHDTAQDDYIYSCAEWCTGHGLESNEHPEGEVETAQCFKCSATVAAKKECCGKKTVCTDRCCDGPCNSRGRCPAQDPCDPNANGDDFSECRLTGDSSLIGVDSECSSHVDWRFDQVLATGEVRLVPSGGTTACKVDTADCTAAPLSSDIASSDGELLLDFSGEQPTYRGHGLTAWNVTLTCPQVAPQTIVVGSNWFAQETPRAYTLGGPLPGVVDADGALQWLWKYAVR